ncbi:MAG: hypothetical protein IK115_13600 [Lachnospiraceae bacterium]|nr:hypothetical protein [Lachnospiraceae bacterium]
MKKQLLGVLLSAVLLFGQVQGLYAADAAEADGSEVIAAEEETQEQELPDAADPEPAEEADPADIADPGPAEEEVTEENADAAVAGLRYGLIVSDPVTIGGKSYSFSAEVAYYSRVLYSGKKIKADTDLQAVPVSTDLEELARELTNAADVSGLIQWKFSAKKNKKCGSDAYFTVKAAVNKSVAKSIGLKGKALTNFKKALKKFNKAAGAVKMRFSICTDPDKEEVPAIKPVKINSKNFPDKNFRKVISGRTYDRDGNHVLDATEIGLTLNIYCEGMKIKSLKGVEYFTDLQGLWCKDNKIKSLDLSKNRDLRGVWCSGNLFTTLDFSDNPELVWVYCYDCKLRSLNVANNPRMAFIECNTNPLTVLDVSRNPELEHLTCGTCELKSLDLSNNPRLAHLDAFSNHFTELDISRNPKMKRLDIWNNPGLGSIDISHNPGLQYYNCAANGVESIDVSHHPELTKLICSYNDITELDLSRNPKLAYLDCACNEISVLDLSENHYVHFLQAFTNTFTELDIGNNPFLIKTYNEGVMKDESAVCNGHSWTIDYGGETSIEKNIYFLCFDDAVDLHAEPTFAFPEYPYTDDDEPIRDDQITREAAVQFLYEMAGSPAVSGSSGFTDVEAGSRYEAALIWGEENHICRGYPFTSSENFGVGRCLRRQDLAYMLMRYSEFAGYNRSIDFGRSDDYIDYFDIDYYAWEAVCWSATWQIISGKGEEGAPKEEQRFDPHGKVTKNEFDAAIDRLMEVNR